MQLMGSGLVSPGHLLIVLVIALLVFGPKRLPELGRSLGDGMRGFKGAMSGDHDDDDDEKPAAVEPPPAPEPAKPEHPED
jgi:sec-independent protein translocase protein TatA